MSRVDDNEKWLRNDICYPYRTSVPKHKSPCPEWWSYVTQTNFAAVPGRDGVIWCFTTESHRDVFQTMMISGY